MTAAPVGRDLIPAPTDAEFPVMVECTIVMSFVDSIPPPEEVAVLPQEDSYHPGGSQ